MRFSKATVVLALMCWLVQGGVMAQQDTGGFEALLSDMGKEPAAVSTSAPAAASETITTPASIVTPATDSVAPAVESVVVPAADEEKAPVAEPMTEAISPVEATVESVPAEQPVQPVSEVAAPEVAAPEVAAPEAAAPEMAAPEVATPEVATPAVEVQVPEKVVAEPAAAQEIQPAVEGTVPTELPSAEAAGQEAAPAAPAVAAEQTPAEMKPAMTEEEAKAMAVQEEVRRRAKELQGIKSMESGYRALAASDFENAAKSFEDALENLPERPANVEARDRSKWGLAEANYRLALDLYRKQGNLQEARQDVEHALRLLPDHKSAASLLQKIANREEILSRPYSPKDRPDVKEKKKTVKQLMAEGSQYYDIKEYNRAESLFEQVLIEDEYNVDAMRYLKKIEDIKYKIRTKERAAAAAGMMQEVRKAWNTPLRKEVKLPETVTAGAVVQTKTGTERLREKMGKIMIPSIEFRMANINDVINFLVEASIAGDEEGVGVNIILNMNIPGEEGAAPAAPAAEDAGVDSGMGFPGENIPAGEGVGAAPGASGSRTITLNLRHISLLDAIKYITEVADLKYRIEDNAIIITPAGVVSGHVITRMYPVQPSILDVIVQKEDNKDAKTGEFKEMGGGKTTITRGDVKDFFQKAGVPFPVGTSITFNPSISQLIVANTPENLDIFERILAQLNVIPSQVEIEARFVEVGENDLEELGLQWILTDNYEIAQKKGSGPAAGSQHVQVNADADGFTKGLRFFSFDSGTAAIDPSSAITKGVNQSQLGGIMTMASVLTNPQLKVILQALSQSGNSDLLSAPRVTTRSGVNAQIQVVREIIYPTEFEVTAPIQTAGSSLVATVTPPTVTPGSFETREIGVILNVTPTVGPDGYTIDLTMVPEVAELVDWIQYGSSMTVAGLDYTFNIPQPVFSSRNATTSIVIWDGQTVVMGGLIREELVTFHDKIPFLGDIPILGRLFRSDGQKSLKTNLLIFVTARLVDPAGKPIHKAEAMAMPGGGSQAQPETKKTL